MNSPVGPAGRPAPIRVLVADDQELVRAGFCVILDAAEDISVVGEASNGADAVAAVAAPRPVVVLMASGCRDGQAGATRLTAQGGPGRRPEGCVSLRSTLEPATSARRPPGAGFPPRTPGVTLIAAAWRWRAATGCQLPSVTRPHRGVRAAACAPCPPCPGWPRRPKKTSAPGRAGPQQRGRSLGTVRRRGDGQDLPGTCWKLGCDRVQAVILATEMAWWFPATHRADARPWAAAGRAQARPAASSPDQVVAEP